MEVGDAVLSIDYADHARPSSAPMEIQRMALKLAVDTEYGVRVEYWRIGTREEHIVNRNLRVGMLGYVSEAAAKAGKAPIAARPASLDHLYCRDATMADLYRIVKKLPAWSQAEDG
jgi:hypothetical protein